MTPCEEKGYKVGQIFKHTGYAGSDKFGMIMVLETDDGSSNPWFTCITSTGPYKEGKRCVDAIKWLTRIYPPEEKKTVSITCEGKTVEISRESAKALNLI